MAAMIVQTDRPSPVHQTLIAALPVGSITSLRVAALDRSPVQGLTHGFYRYPARFSPIFVSSAIEHLSAPGQVVLDPYMGGGTTIVEAYARQRVAIGCDLNSLAVFVTSAKVSKLSEDEKMRLRNWALKVVPSLSYRTVTDELADLICPLRTRNLGLPRARPAKKLIALAMLSARDLPGATTQDFARAVLLNVAQWALNNRKQAPTLDCVRDRISRACFEMIVDLDNLQSIANTKGRTSPPILIHGTAVELPKAMPFSNGVQADLVVTSPPYPGIHILYHRWQVDGRKETPAPYWIAGCQDGMGSSYYNFADRRKAYEEQYFSESLKTLRSIRNVLRTGALMVQMIAFSKPRRQLSEYLANMHNAGFTEVREADHGDSISRFRRIWRHVPGRAWHASLKGSTPSSREVVLIHRAA